MSSKNVTLTGKLTQWKARKNFTNKETGKEGSVQELVLFDKTTNTSYIIKLWHSDEVSSDYRDKDIEISKLLMNDDGTFRSSRNLFEIEDRLDSSVDDQYDENTLVAPVLPHLNDELSKYTITVTRSKDYQSITLSEEFTGSFAELDAYFDQLNKKCLLFLERMPKL